VAPQEIAPGESVQLTVNAIHSDGSVRNVTGQAQWTSLTSEILQVSSTGIATGKKGGEVVVTALFSGRSASAPVLVLPKGTFRLAGFIRESGIGIADVTVALISGVGEGLTATSRIDGGYALYGVSGSTLIQAKKEGYVNSIQQLDVTAHRTFDFSMVVERARRDYSGYADDKRRHDVPASR